MIAVCERLRDLCKERHNRIEELEAQLEAVRERTIAETVGWTFAYACAAVDGGKDILQIEFPAVLEQGLRQLKALEKQE